MIQQKKVIEEGSTEVAPGRTLSEVIKSLGIDPERITVDTVRSDQGHSATDNVEKQQSFVHVLVNSFVCSLLCLDVPN